MRMTIAVAAIVASAVAAGCSRDNREDGGASVSRNYQVGDFQQIEVAGPYDVEVRTGSNPSVTASGPEKLLARTVVEVEGDRLIIHPEQNRNWLGFGWSSRGNARFVVTVPRLNGASIAGSGDIKIDRIQGERFEGGIAGSGAIELGAVEVQTLKLGIAGSGDVRAAAGRAENVEYDVAGSGDVHAESLQAQHAKISIAGSGDVRAHAARTANVNIMGSGEVRVSGGAKCTVQKSGSGEVHCS